MGQKKYSTGVFLESGGNKTFFSNGVLKVLSDEKIVINKVVGFSAATAIGLAYILDKNVEGLEIFVKQLNANKSNFYFRKRKPFPHNDIYKSSIQELLQHYDNKNSTVAFVLLAASSKNKLVVPKTFLATATLLCGLFVPTKGLPLFRTLFGFSPIELKSELCPSKDTILNFIMGSSTVWPFIRPHYHGEHLLLNGVIVEPKFEDYLIDCEKKIVIHLKKGETGIVGDTFHIYPDTKIPFNVFDYTDGSKIIDLHNLGEKVMKDNLPLLRQFLTKT